MFLGGLGEKKIITSSVTHTWRKPCKLQIAYTSHKVPVESKLLNSNKIFSLENSSKNSSKLKKLLNRNDLNDTSLCNDNFLKNLDEDLSKHEANKFGLIKGYVNNQLVFRNNNCNDYDFNKDFIFNHTIHIIIYEGKSRCRMNLSQKFT